MLYSKTNFPMTYIGIPFSHFPKDITNEKLLSSLQHIGGFIDEDLQLDRAEMYLKDYNPEYSEYCIQDDFANKLVTQLTQNKDKLLSNYYDFHSHLSPDDTPSMIFGLYVHGVFGELTTPTEKQMEEYKNKNLESFKKVMKEILDEDIYETLIQHNIIRLDTIYHSF